MRIVIAGGHGKIAMILSSQLSVAGHHPVGIIRNAAHAAELKATGAEPLVLDLEQSDVEHLSTALAGADAVVFAAGAGPNSGAERKLTVDRDGAILLANAAVAAGVRRMIVVSAIGTDDFDADSDDQMQVYLRAKSEADAAVRATDLDYTIVRPGGLTDDEPTGLVTVGETVERGNIPRADVAAVIAQLIEDGSAPRTQFELVSGSTPIASALHEL
ncbi:SDR family oxidoreductase [Marisediminicola senii]|uniref:SDR family oxidoreductase n=1 Tax=Marisediminicola senii TaxID=2711233 RepID=UPI0013EDA60A|nr:SDR family oxidoreductase [Marisediminicola senii]